MALRFFDMVPGCHLIGPGTQWTVCDGGKNYPKAIVSVAAVDLMFPTRQIRRVEAAPGAKHEIEEDQRRRGFHVACICWFAAALVEVGV